MAEPRAKRPDGRLRRQGEATRARLLEAAVPALAERGYHATRVDDLVDRAGVSHGTFYTYFQNKEDFFRALATQCADEAAALAASLGPVPPGAEGRAVLRPWLAEFLVLYQRYGVVIRAWAENQVSDRQLARMGSAAFGRIADTLTASMGDDPSRPSRAVQLRSSAVLAMLERFAYVITSRDLGLDEDAVLDNLTLVVQRAFFAPATESLSS